MDAGYLCWRYFVAIHLYESSHCGGVNCFFSEVRRTEKTECVLVLLCEYPVSCSFSSGYGERCSDP